MPGNPTTHEAFTAMGVQYLLGDQLHGTCNNASLAKYYELGNVLVSASASRCATAANSCSALDVWTK